MTFVGLTALSVDTITNFCTPYFTAKSATTFEPNTLFTMATVGLISIMGTCL